MSNPVIQFIAALGTLVLAVAVLNPFGILMPTAIAMTLLAALFVAFCLFAVFVIREKAVDERDREHRAFAGHVAFLAGSALLVLGIIAEDLTHTLDSWLVIALIGMVLGKLIARLYADRRR